jgi:hypothetical protein
MEKSVYWRKNTGMIDKKRATWKKTKTHHQATQAGSDSLAASPSLLPAHMGVTWMSHHEDLNLGSDLIHLTQTA